MRIVDLFGVRFVTRRPCRATVGTIAIGQSVGGMVPQPQRHGQSKSPSGGVVALLAIGGLFTNLFIVVAALAVVGAIFGADTEPTATQPATATARPSSPVATTTTTAAPPAQYTVTEATSGDAVVVNDGTRNTTITIAGIDAPDTATAQCWAAQARQFAVDTLTSQQVVIDGTLTAGMAVPRLLLADGRDYAVIATAAGAVRAASTAETAVKDAEAAAKLAGLGLWGSPCYGELVTPPPAQPPVPAPAPSDPPTDDPAPAPDVYFANCDAARAAGAAPLYRGEPGYRPGLDRDGDGVACEP